MNFKNYLKEGSGYGASLSMEALSGAAGEGGGSFAGDPVGYERKALEMGISLHGVPMGNLEWVRLLGTFDIWFTGVLEVGHLSLWELCEGKQE